MFQLTQERNIIFSEDNEAKKLRLTLENILHRQLDLVFFNVLSDLLFIELIEVYLSTFYSPDEQPHPR